ncbi:MAG: hypothetical protein A2161_04350 [Candidatus Schekmanbacteria bacterium RBG_13_48_7]|uniref:Flagellar protein n=1 Tax=Candidatus Schekmanbacteria bacterium RBG_13_48_7 TaxID=1817878 RepID=A0A1F7RU29_9BACT|nr:MAG: hypothetical protein A2161_04350 [Candidatus Schekmanbacteria bacterium RBG_13_48_7]
MRRFKLHSHKLINSHIFFIVIILLIYVDTGIVNCTENLPAAENLSHTDLSDLDNLLKSDSENKIDFTKSLINMAGSLIFILALIICVIFVIKKFKFGNLYGKSGQDIIKLLELKTFGDRHKIGVFEIGKHILVIGFHQQGMELLKEFEDSQKFSSEINENLGIKSKSSNISDVKTGYSKFLTVMMNSLHTKFSKAQPHEH